MKLLDFLFGKKPPIFDKKGMVQHQLKEKSWSEWKDRYIESPENDWRHHSGKSFNQERERKSNETSDSIKA